MWPHPGQILPKKNRPGTKFGLKQRLERSTIFLFGLRATSPDQRSRELALRILFVGTLSLILVAFVVICVNYFFLHLAYLAPRIGIISIVGIGMLLLYYLSLRQHYTIASFGILAFYFGAASIVMWNWGIETPIAVLLFALVVIFAGILLGARYSLYALGVVVGLQLLYVLLVAAHITQPDTSWADASAHFYDVIVFAVILGNIALISWLFNRSMERSLRRAWFSERALQRQKRLLEVRVEERARQLQTTHLERLQELYRFAELGDMSVALLHDMVNYLTVLSVDIADLNEAQKDRSAIMQRVQQGIEHLNNLIGQIRQQIKGEEVVKQFNVADEIDYIKRILSHKAAARQVVVGWSSSPKRKDLFYTGPVSHWRQVVANIISNAIDAYEGTETQTRKVEMAAELVDAHIVVSITDFGKLISPSKQEKIFEPFYSTKPNGVGIGLAIVKQMVEKKFTGQITVTSSRTRGTTFTITLPLKKKRSREAHGKRSR